MNARELKLTAAHVRAALVRLALHYPRSRQIESIDVLAEDYAKDCRAMTCGEFDDAVDDARAHSRFWPTSADIRTAHERLQEARRMAVVRAQLDQQRIGDEAMEITDEMRERNLERVRELRAALNEGRRPSWVQ